MDENKQVNFSDSEQQAIPLLVYHEADDYLKDNEYIIKGYRIGYNKILRVLKSLFMCHNESANIWSHIIGLLMFFACIFYVCILLIDSSSNFENLILFHDSSVNSNSNSCDQICYNLSNDIKSYLPVLSEFIESKNATNLTAVYRGAMQSSQKVQQTIQNSISSNCCCFKTMKNSEINEKFEESKLITECDVKTSLLKKILQNIVLSIENYFETNELNNISFRSIFQLLLQQSLELNIETEPLKQQDFTHHSGFFGDVSKIPLIVHILCAMLCLFFSSLFHLFCCHSKEVCTVLSRFDYGGIAVLIAGSCVPQYIYSFYCPQNAYYGYIYTSVIFLACAAAFTVSLIPKFDAPRFRKFRAGLFVIVGLSSAVPGFHVLVFRDPDLSSDPPYFLLALGGAIYILGAVIYSTRVPERFWKGKFDYIGNSHNIWHTFVLGAACVHFYASIIAYEDRINMQCPS